MEDALQYNAVGNYSYSLYGPNGFVRFFSGNALKDELIQFNLETTLKTLIFKGMPEGHDYELIDNTYGQSYNITGSTTFEVDLTGGYQNGWYNLTLRSENQTWERKFMGRVELGHEGITDPAMAVDQFSDEDDIHPDNHVMMREMPAWFEIEACTNPGYSNEINMHDQCAVQSYNSTTFKQYLLNDVLFL